MLFILNIPRFKDYQSSWKALSDMGSIFAICILNTWTKVEHKTQKDCKPPSLRTGHNHFHGGLNSRYIALQLCLPGSRDGDHQAHSILLEFPLAMNGLHLLEMGKTEHDILRGENSERCLCSCTSEELRKTGSHPAAVPQGWLLYR